MPSTFDTLLRLELQAVGENASTWGTKTNTNLELIAQAIAGHISVNVGGGAAYSLLTAQASTDEVRQMFITFNGVLTSSIPVYIPASPGSWYIRDNTSGAFSITVKTSAGTGVSLTRTGLNVLACDGVSVYPAAETNRVNRTGDSMTGTLSLPAGTSVSASQAMRNDEITAHVSTAVATRIPTGSIILWYGSVGSIPAGWLLCDGTNGTPDLRGRFIIGAGGDYAVSATGGSFDATTSVGGDHAHGGITGQASLTAAQIPSHTHAVDLYDPGHTHAITPLPTVYSVGSNQVGSSGVLLSPTTMVAAPASAGITVSIGATGGSGGHDHVITSAGSHSHGVSVIPPYYALCYIMKT